MTEQDVGPIDYLTLEFPTKTDRGGPGRVDRPRGPGIIRILDLRFVRRAEDGSFSAVAVTDLDGDGVLDLAVFEGVESVSSTRMT